MSRCILSVVAIVSLILSSGCNSTADGRAVLQKELDLFTELGNLLAGIKDKAGVQSNSAKVKELCDQIWVIQQEANKTRVMKSAENTLEKEFQGKFENAGMKVGMEMVRVAQIEGGAQIQSTIQDMLAKITSSIKKN